MIAGGPVRPPPTRVHGPQPNIVYERAYIASSLPRTATSMRPGPHPVAPGPPTSPPPRLSHALHALGPASYHRWTRSPPAPRANRSRRPYDHDAAAGVEVIDAGALSASHALQPPW